MSDERNLDGLGAVAAADQGRAIARQWAVDVASYHHALREQGCCREAALWLTRDFQAIYLGHLWPFPPREAS